MWFCIGDERTLFAFAFRGFVLCCHRAPLLRGGIQAHVYVTQLRTTQVTRYSANIY